MEIGESVRFSATGGGAAEEHPAKDKGPPALRVVKVLGPAQVEPCRPARYKVVAYNRLAKPEEKQRVRWEVRIAGESAAISDPGERTGDTLLIAKVPEEYAGVRWVGRVLRVYAYLNGPAEQASTDTSIQCFGICRYIALVKKVEKATGWDPETVLNALRRLAGYDTEKFQLLYGSAPARALVPTGDLTAEDIFKLGGLSSHSVFRTGREIGAIEDSLGHKVAIGHVLTGLSAGQHRNREADLRPWFGQLAGHTLDNLYAATLAGDIGQSAVEIHQNGGSTEMGFVPELTEAEAVGDIDGLIMGTEGGLNGKPVSVRLHDYYCVTSSEPPGSNAAHRFENFNASYVDEHLLGESRRFAVNYLYSRSESDGLVDSTETEVNDIFSSFQRWLVVRVKREQQRPKELRTHPPL